MVNFVNKFVIQNIVSHRSPITPSAAKEDAKEKNVSKEKESSSEKQKSAESELKVNC